MENDGQIPGTEVLSGKSASSPSPGARTAPAARLPRVRSLVIGLTVLAAVSLSFYFLRLMAPETSAQNKDEPAKPSSVHFVGWSKPDLAIIVTGQMHGYIQPCGCSHP